MTRTDAASRVIAAAPARVYAALVDADALAIWLPPAGMTGRLERFDPRPGGSFRMVLTYVEGSADGKTTADSDVVDVRILELVPDERVVWAADFVSDDPAYAGTMTMSFDLRAVAAGRTILDVTADGVPDGVSAEDHAAGLRSSLENLAGLLTA